MGAAFGAGGVARAMWELYELIHAVTYFAPESADAYKAAGLRGYWRGYFAGRAAPLGRVPAGPVTGAFFGFAPAFVGRALPSVWDMVDPEDALAARTAGATAAIERVLPGPPDEMERAVPLLETAVAGLGCAGRVLAAANAELPPAASVIGRLWQAATVLREHRGDGHVAALVTADLDGCEALCLRAGMDLSRTALQPNRGWTDDEWRQAQDRLRSRGLFDPGGRVTSAGRELVERVEDVTDQVAERPWARLGHRRCAELHRLLAPISAACAAVVPYPNPIGLRPPT